MAYYRRQDVDPTHPLYLLITLSHPNSQRMRNEELVDKAGSVAVTLKPAWWESYCELRGSEYIRELDSKGWSGK